MQVPCLPPTRLLVRTCTLEFRAACAFSSTPLSRRLHWYISALNHVSALIVALKSTFSLFCVTPSQTNARAVIFVNVYTFAELTTCYKS